MSDQVIIAAIGLAQTTIIGYFAYQQRKQGQHIEDIKGATNGMQKKLQEAAHAAGVLDEKNRAENQKSQNKE